MNISGDAIRAPLPRARAGVDAGTGSRVSGGVVPRAALGGSSYLGLAPVTNAPYVSGRRS